MKKLLFIIYTSFLLTICCYGQPRQLSDMIGRWKIAGEQNAGATLEIIDSVTIILTYGGELRRITNIKMDFSKSPYWFDFIAHNSSSSFHVKSLVEIKDNMMKWQLFIDEERAPYFTIKNGELLYLKKTKTNSATAGSQ